VDVERNIVQLSQAGMRIRIACGVRFAETCRR
jgi:hypothetical protein